MLLNLYLHTRNVFGRVDAALWFRNQSSIAGGSPRLCLITVTNRCMPPMSPTALFSKQQELFPGMRGFREKEDGSAENILSLDRSSDYYSQKIKNVPLDNQKEILKGPFF